MTTDHGKSRNGCYMCSRRFDSDRVTALIGETSQYMKTQVTVFRTSLLYMTIRSSAVRERPHDALCHKHFAKSLKIIQTDTLKSGVYKSLLVFLCSYICISHHF